jgi:hypothetical protein
VAATGRNKWGGASKSAKHVEKAATDARRRKGEPSKSASKLVRESNAFLSVDVSDRLSRLLETVDLFEPGFISLSRFSPGTHSNLLPQIVMIPLIGHLEFMSKIRASLER